MSGACEYSPPKHEGITKEKPEDKRLEILRLIAIAIITVGIAWLQLIPSTMISNVIITLAVIIGGYPIFKESFLALKKGRVNMELSMVIAIIASLLLLQFLPAIVITFFALLSEFIEEFIVERGRRNIEILYEKAPKKALVKRNQNDTDPLLTKTSSVLTEIPVDEVKMNDIVIVREGDAVPIDGQIINGSSTIDQSSITGESMPVEKSVGDFVFAGTINLSSKLEVLCKRASKDTTYAKIIHMVEEAESSKAPIQKLSDKMATRLIQFAIGLSVVTFIATHNIVSTLSVIVVAGACGLAVGTPIALLASNSKLAKNGIIVKGGLQIENIQKAGTIVFDKTGTLTVGRPTVRQIISFDKSIEKNKVLEYAAIAERDVNHPLAKAIVEKALDNQIKFKDGQCFSISNSKVSENNENKSGIIVGRGVSQIYDGHRITVGNIHFLKEQIHKSYGKNIEQLNPQLFLSSSKSTNDPFNEKLATFDKHTLPLSEESANQYTTVNNNVISNSDTLQVFKADSNRIDEYTSSLFSSTNVLVALDTKIIGAIVLEDDLRFGSKDVISTIKSMGIHTVMLTGDNKNIAEKIAKEIGIDEYYADLLPEDKVTKIKEIVNRAQYQKTKKKDKENKNIVIMVGDGINDAPALAEADIGIAMGKTGTDIAIETADVVLMKDDLAKLPYIIKSSRKTIFTIKQNFFGTLAVDGFGFILAFAGILHPLLAAFIHVSSELLFMINSARLLRGDS